MKKSLIILAALFTFFVGVAQEKPNGLALQSIAPDFTAKDQYGKNINLADLRKSGPVVILFYRGHWCPFCNKQLKALQDSLQFLKAKGASIIAITPEAQEGVEKTMEKTGTTFPIIHDKDVMIGMSYKVSYQVDTATVAKYKTNWNVDFLKINQQNDKAYLPVPAVYIIDKKGIITYRFFETDIRKRPTVKELLDNL